MRSSSWKEGTRGANSEKRLGGKECSFGEKGKRGITKDPFVLTVFLQGQEKEFPDHKEG